MVILIEYIINSKNYEIFSGTSILRYELGLIGRASTNILKVGLGLCAHCGPKYKRNEIELRSFHHSIRLDELIILVWSFAQIGYIR